MNKKLLGFDNDKLVQWFLYWTITGVGTFILLFLITATWIGVSVGEKCLVAQGKYPGAADCSEALIKTLDDDTNSYHERNDAIWGLGQLGNPKAKPTIEKYYTGDIPGREPYDENLSQYEMQKALKLLNGGVNLTHVVWKIN